jgi:ankyrin repeat protein
MNDESNDRESPIDLAIENRKVAAVKLCIEHGANVRKTCRDVQSSTLHIAAAVGDVPICLLLLEQDKKLVHMRNVNRETPLHRALSYDRKQAADLLLNW